MIDKNYSLNCSYYSQGQIAPKNRSISPVVTQLMRKDKEIEIMRDELSQQNFMIDDLYQQIHYLEKQLKENENFKEKYQSLSEDYNSQLKEIPKLKVPIQITSAKEIMNQFIDYQNNEQCIKFEKIDNSEFYKYELQESLIRELNHKEIISIIIQECYKMNTQIHTKNNDILKITLDQLEELVEQNIQKEEQILFYKEKNRLLYELLQCSMDINTLYKKQHQSLRSALKGCWTINIDQSKQVEQIIKLIDQGSKFNNLKDLKSLIENNEQKNISKSTNYYYQLEKYINNLKEIEGKSPFEKIKNMIEKINNYSQIYEQNDQMYLELQYYKQKLEEQDETIKDFERLLVQMEENFQQQINSQELQLQDINQKNELITHYQILLDDFKSQLSQKQQNELQNESINNQENIQIEDILKIIILIIQGYDVNNNEYILNINQDQIIPLHDQIILKYNTNNCNKQISYQIINQSFNNNQTQEILNPIINNQINQIQQIIFKQFQLVGKSYFEITNSLINSIQIMKQQLPQSQLKSFLSNNCLEYIEKFNQISHRYFIKQEKITSSEKEFYRKNYGFINRMISEIIQSQTQLFIKLLREKAYQNIMNESNSLNKSYF